MSELRLEELAASNIVAANTLSLKPGQEQFVAPVSHSIAEAYVNPATAWPRVVLEDDEVVGFIMGNFDPDAHEDEFKACIWRINVAADAQGHGVGRFAVLAVADEARRRGLERITVIYEPGEAGPAAFFEKIGFTPYGETPYGETVAALEL
ncbi:GNAT family N-acetyltransferase [Herbiconiux sp. VKM Ac-1786]|uniref:GNAT family N-acetyltransferase n=1 Tax=Herbiconiux sp. VKM Ac-1786 TaxID=2783824 RepID=UPI00188B42B1|nr:GNAT family N-acetyltransferase [Herbiconiux sp. VKM Ac-1786]MBF4571353.1 GNAT family N-acetyltransferase [Herbiconiux sp. VKM Ac-1786]